MSFGENEDFAEELGIDFPEKCDGCAVLCRLYSQAAITLVEIQKAKLVGTALVGEEGEDFDKMVDEHFPDEDTDEVKSTARRLMSAEIDMFEEDLEELKQEINANTVACSGVLRASAERRGIKYSVNVCTSPRLYDLNGDLHQHVPTHIRAET